MTTTLVLQTVGTQDVQDEILDEFSNATLGPGARINGRALGEWLVSLDDDALCDVISYETLRNGPCYGLLDSRHACWTLALLATDQPQAHPGDTIDIARAVTRWFAICKPLVNVLEPQVITCAPHLATNALSAQIERLLADLRDGQHFDSVVALPHGGTPATRVLLEHVAGRVFVAADKIERLLPDGNGGCHDDSLLRTVEADFVAHQSEQRLLDAITSARYATARERAEDLRELGLASDELERWCEAGRRIVEDEPDWTIGLPPSNEATGELRRTENALGRLGAYIAVVERLSRSGAVRDAMTRFVTASEFISLAWCETVAKVSTGKLLELPWAEPPCLPDVRPARSTTSVDRAGHAAVCATSQCAGCPLARHADGQKILNARGAAAARAIREHTRELRALRNDGVHTRDTPQVVEDQLKRRIDRIVPVLGKHFDVGDNATLASLLADSADAAIRSNRPDPLHIVDDQIVRLLHAPAD